MKDARKPHNYTTGLDRIAEGMRAIRDIDYLGFFLLLIAKGKPREESESMRADVCRE